MVLLMEVIEKQRIKDEPVKEEWQKKIKNTIQK